jgi:hypothetical protein
MELFFPINKDERLRYTYRRLGSDEDGQADILTWIERFSSRLSENAGDAEAAENLSQICKLVLTRSRLHKFNPPASLWARETPPFPDEVLARVLRVSVDLSDKVSFMGLFEMCPEEADLVTFRAVGMALLRFDLESLLPK